MDTREGFGAVLKATLLRQGAQLTEATTEPKTATGLQLFISKLQEGKTVSAYSAVRQVREFNHFIEVSYSIRRADAAGDVPLIPSPVRAERTQIYDSRYVLGVAEEERQIQRELQAEAARLLTIRLGAF
ncbi:MAG: hypothetical protein R3E95_00365 [Thiolinea sp.]